MLGGLFKPRQCFRLMWTIPDDFRLTPALRRKAALSRVGHPDLDRPQSSLSKGSSMLLYALYYVVLHSVTCNIITPLHVTDARFLAIRLVPTLAHCSSYRDGISYYSVAEEFERLQGAFCGIAMPCPAGVADYDG